MINSNAAKSLNTQGISKSEDLEIKRKWMNVNRQFLNDMQRLERSLGGMDQRQKCVASEWIGKLKTNPPNLDEAVARNKILTFLLNCMGPTLLIKKPLSTPPVLHRFTNISHLMSERNPDHNDASELLNSAFDGGAFSSKLPVPRYGAFFVVHLRQNF